MRDLRHTGVFQCRIYDATITRRQSNPDNLIYVCSNCNGITGRQPSEIDFTAFLAGLMQNNPMFTKINLEKRFGKSGKYRADIAARRKRSGKFEDIIVECKSLATLSGPRLPSIISKLDDYAQDIDNTTLILSFPGRADAHSISALEERGFEVWDLERIGEIFKDQIVAESDSYFASIIRKSEKDLPIEEKFVKELKLCEAGWKDWAIYQKLVGNILEHLFCPSLRQPLEENADSPRANRRDFIFPNYSADGFWMFLRARYSADYIVVDAKNGKGKIKKSHIFQVANYLKEHGVGMFGIIISRLGPDASALVTLREQWAMNRKLIITLNHSDIESMLLAKLASGDPSSVIGDRIQEFRLMM